MINRTFAHKIAILSLAAAAALLVSTKAMAQSSTNVRIEQKSIISLYGKWTFSSPGNTAVYTGKSSVAIKDFSTHVDGTYTFDIKAPSNATTTVSVYEDGVKKQSDAGTLHMIDIDSTKQYRIVVEYAYDGTIRVNSQPNGAPFDLVSPYDITISGTTPAVFHRLPVQYFTVHYRDMDGCYNPRPQKRVSDNEILFFGRYNCTPVKPKEKVEPFEDKLRGSVNISLAPNQTEIIAGENVYYTISVDNRSKQTMNNLSVSFQFDSEHMQVKDILPWNGTLTNHKTIVWDIDKIFAGKTWEATFPVEVLAGTSEGTILAANARVSGPEVRKETSINLQSATNVGVAILPATGMRFDILFLVMSILVALGLSRSAKNRQ